MEPAVTGLDWPFTTIPKSRECFARQQPCGPPSLVRATSTCSGIDRPASGFNAVIPGPYVKTMTLTHKKNVCCDHIGFPTTTKISTFLASPQQKTPWPVFQDGRCNTSPILLIIQCYHCLFQKKFIPYMPHLAITIWFQVLFHTPTGVLFSFPSRYFYTIGLETYLELGVDASQNSNPISNGSYSTYQKKP